ncbi:hypothetical protein F511_45610 [Dorcoceras hygrometricum]|uniref:Uncharacterized protein n=1 Tax=Dorcoceras hygrometricum TaxID=472368 RepID=A0A2Z6ZVH5_9LAMI|nr:hypothetical protein F511_45610 [Dorcoceras hygrometricum]
MSTRDACALAAHGARPLACVQRMVARRRAARGCCLRDVGSNSLEGGRPLGSAGRTPGGLTQAAVLRMVAPLAGATTGRRSPAGSATLRAAVRRAWRDVVRLPPSDDAPVMS